MKFKEFLNPKSMLTPAIAGSFIMIIANTLWFQFALPQKWSALFLSFIFLIPVLQAYSASMIEKGVYFFFNGLIVFAMAVNTNFAGKVLTSMASEADHSNVQASIESFSPIRNANAEDARVKTTTKTVTTVIKTTTDPTGNTTTTQSATVEKENKKTSDDSTKRKFFTDWLD